MAIEHKQKIIAGGLFVAAGLLTIFAVILTYTATKRYFAYSALERYAVKHFERDNRGMRNTAKEAADWLGNDARATLPSIDPLAGDALDRLSTLRNQVPPAQRHLVTTAKNLILAINDQPLEDAGDMRGSNASLIEHIVELREQAGSSVPELPSIDPYAAPDFEVLARTLEERVLAAWLSTDVPLILDGLAKLRFFDGQHPAADDATALVQVLTGGSKEADMARMVPSALRRRGTNTIAVARRALIIIAANREDIPFAAERITEIINLIPSDQRTAAETALWMQNAGNDLSELVASAKRSKDQAVLTAAINRCMQAGEYDLVLDLAQSLEPSDKRRLEIAVAERRWDLATIQELAPNPEAYLPTVRRPRIAGNTIVFHVASASGAVPDRALNMSVNGTAIPSDQQQRFASLVSIPNPTAGAVRLQVGIDQTLIFDGEVTP